MKASLELIPTLIVHPSHMVVYNQVHWYPTKPTSKKNTNFIEPTKERDEKFVKSTRKANGNVSDNAKRKLEKAIEYIITTSYEKRQQVKGSEKIIKFKIAFITLTLPSKQSHTDLEITNRCLNSMIDELKKYYKIHNYVWRAEKQKNGNLHFHIIIDKFVPWSELRDRWNRIINKLGYVDNYRKFLKEWHISGFKVRTDLLKNWDEQSQRLAYQKGKSNDYNNPNSIDIHSTKHIRNIKQYLSKYMSKNEYTQRKAQTENEDFTQSTGRIWGCNHELSNIKGYQCEIDTETSGELEKIVKSGKARVYSSTYFTVFYIDWHKLRSIGANWLFGYFSNYLLETFNYSEQLEFST